MGSSVSVESRPASGPEATAKSSTSNTKAGPSWSATLANRKRPAPPTEDDDEETMKDKRPNAKRVRHEVSYRERAGALASLFPSGDEIRGFLEYMASTESPDLEEESVGIAMLQTSEQLQDLTPMHKKIDDAVRSSTQTAEGLKKVNENRLKKLTEYGLWLDKNGDALSHTKDVRKEGRKLRKEIQDLTTISGESESFLKEEMQLAPRLEKEMGTLYKEVGEEVRAMFEELGSSMNGEEAPESADTSGDESMSDGYFEETLSVESYGYGVRKLSRGTYGSFDGLDELLGEDLDVVEELGIEGKKRSFEWPDDAF